MSEARHDDPRHPAAVAAMFLAGFLFALMGISTKALHSPLAGRAIPASEVALFRFVFGVLVMLPLFAVRDAALLGRDRRGLLLRGVAGGFAVYTYFLSIHHTSLANAVLLNYTSLIFAPLFAAFTLGERISRRAAAAIALALLGIVLVTRPEMGGVRLGDGYGLLSGFLAGIAITSIRHLRQTESAWSVFFYLSLIGAPIALVACIGQPPAWPTGNGWLLLLAMGASSVGAQILMTYGYRYVRAAEGGLITLSQVVYTSAAGALWFREPLRSETLAGGALILGSALWLSLAPAGKTA